MDAATIMGFVIISIVAFIMVIIGVYQMMKKNEPVGFYNMIAPPKKNEITNINMWNNLDCIWCMYRTRILLKLCYANR